MLFPAGHVSGSNGLPGILEDDDVGALDFALAAVQVPAAGSENEFVNQQVIPDGGWCSPSKPWEL